MIYSKVGRATSVVGRLPGKAATSGREMGQALWLLIFSLFHSITTAQTLGVKPIDAVGIDPTQAQAITERVQEIASRYQPTVDRNRGLQELLDEHALNQATGQETSLGLNRADRIISGSAGTSAQDRWFISLCMTDVTTSRTLGCKHATVSNYKDLLTISKTVTKALLQGTLIEDDEHVTTIADSTPVIIGTGKIIQEIHVYEHKAGTHQNKRFVPCSYCQGRGKVPCHECPFGGERDCPYCSATSRYGTTANGPGLTGHWIP